MTDKEALSLIKFIMMRYMGFHPEDRLLLNALDDWRKEQTNGESTMDR